MPLVYIRSDVSAAAETHSQNYTRMYSFDDAATQMRRIFQKVIKERYLQSYSAQR